jgi:hypothetical protein
MAWRGLPDQSFLENKNWSQCQLWGKGELFIWGFFSQVAEETSQYQVSLCQFSVPESCLITWAMPMTRLLRQTEALWIYRYQSYLQQASVVIQSIIVISMCSIIMTFT